MRTDITCALNGTDLHGLDQRIYVEDIKEEPVLAAETAKLPGWGSALVNAPGRERLDIRVTVYIKERDLEERIRLIQKIFGWATEGWFTRSQRPGLRIYVWCTKLPQIGTFDRSNRLEITFTAYNPGYWEQVTPVSKSLTGTGGSTPLTLDCTEDAYLEASITPSGGSLTSCSIASGGQTIALTGLSVASGKTITISYNELHLQQILCDGVSLADHRTAASADHIRLGNGLNTITCSASRSSTFTFSARGLYR